MSDGNHLPLAGETACPTYFAKRLIQQGKVGQAVSPAVPMATINGRHLKMNKFPKTVRHPLLRPRLIGAEHAATGERAPHPSASTPIHPKSEIPNFKRQWKHSMKFDPTAYGP